MRELRFTEEMRQKQAAARMRCNKPAPIFTIEFVESMTSAEIAQLLDDCFYDLVRTERRLLLDRNYDEFRKQARRLPARR